MHLCYIIQLLLHNPLLSKSYQIPKKYSTAFGNFHYFSITQILREINLENCRSAKSAIFIHLEALDFDLFFYINLALFVTCNLPNSQNSDPLNLREAALSGLLDSPKMISRKI